MQIELKSVSIEFPILGPERKRLFSGSNLSSLLGGKIESRNRMTFVSALKKINLLIEKGDRLALIGSNGAGKSTLLRLISGIYKPTFGEIAIEGRVTPLLDTGFGMDNDSTGYENIDIGCMFAGLSKSETEAVKKDVADFTELREFLEMPIRTYSSGMRSRLSFAIATARPPEILAIDEGIGAGDKNFQEKAKERLNNFMGNTQILVLASHSKTWLTNFCNKGLWLEKGEIVALGPLDQVLEAYYNAD